MRLNSPLSCLILFTASNIAVCLSGQSSPEMHLFILSGQSNMAGLDPDLSFTPQVKKHFENDQVIVVKDAQGGQPIRRWYKGWELAEGQSTEQIGDLYDRLMEKVHKAIGDQTPDTITFVWMQGERDARESNGERYADSLNGLVQQLQVDLDRRPIHLVVGRLSDFDMDNSKYPHWTIVREAQRSVCDSLDTRAWVNTDDLNGPKDDLHYTPDGYLELGKRFAEKAVEMIDNR